jgi:hypothetical protein
MHRQRVGTNPTLTTRLAPLLRCGVEAGAGLGGSRFGLGLGMHHLGAREQGDHGEECRGAMQARPLQTYPDSLGLAGNTISTRSPELWSDRCRDAP